MNLHLVTQCLSQHERLINTPRQALANVPLTVQTFCNLNRRASVWDMMEPTNTHQEELLNQSGDPFWTEFFNFPPEGEQLHSMSHPSPPTGAPSSPEQDIPVGPMLEGDIANQAYPATLPEFEGSPVVARAPRLAVQDSAEPVDSGNVPRSKPVPAPEHSGSADTLFINDPAVKQAPVTEGWLSQVPNPGTTTPSNKHTIETNDENCARSKKQRSSDSQIIIDYFEMSWKHNDNPTWEWMSGRAGSWNIPVEKMFNWYQEKREQCKAGRKQQSPQRGMMEPPALRVNDNRQSDDNGNGTLAVQPADTVQTHDNNMRSTATRSNHRNSNFSTQETSFPEETLSQTTVSQKPGSKGPYLCTKDTCSWSYIKPSDWRRHEDTHWPHKRYLCVVCTIDSNGSDSALFCVHCRTPFVGSDLDKIKEHALEKCDVVPRKKNSLARDFDLRQHLSDKHTGDRFYYFKKTKRQWICLLCPQNRPTNLVSEQEAIEHTSICGLSNSNEGQRLQRRVLLKHNFEERSGGTLDKDWFYELPPTWPSQCKFCPRKFSSLESRREHSLSHFDLSKDADESAGKGLDRDDDEGGHDSKTRRDNDSQNDNSQPRGNNDNIGDEPNTHGSGRNGDGSSGQRQRPSPSQEYGDMNDIREFEELSELCPDSNVRESEVHQEPSSILSLGVLGSGATSNVDEVFDCKHPGQILARKSIIPDKSISKRFTFEKVAREIMLLKKLRHPHIVNLVDSYRTPHSVELLMSPVADCDLAMFMANCGQNTANDSTCDSGMIGRMSGWVACMSSALAYMHGEGVVHGDLKPQNILVKGPRVWVADFGIAKAEKAAESDHFSMTPMYCSREVRDRKSRGRPADIWSFGCVVLEICDCMAGKSIPKLQEPRKVGKSKPYHEDIQETLRWLELLGAVSEHLDRLRSVAHILEAVASMLLPEPQARATAEQVRGQLAPGNCCQDVFVDPSETPKEYTSDVLSSEADVLDSLRGSTDIDEIFCRGHDFGSFPQIGVTPKNWVHQMSDTVV